MKKYKTSAILYYIASVCWFIASFLNFTSDNTWRGVIYLCLGALMLCCGSQALNKYKKSKNNELDEKEQNKSED